MVSLTDPKVPVRARVYAWAARIGLGAGLALLVLWQVAVASHAPAQWHVWLEAIGKALVGIGALAWVAARSVRTAVRDVTEAPPPWQIYFNAGVVAGTVAFVFMILWLVAGDLGLGAGLANLCWLLAKLLYAVAVFGVLASGWVKGWYRGAPE